MWPGEAPMEDRSSVPPPQMTVAAVAPWGGVEIGVPRAKKDAGVRMGRGGQILSSGSGDGRLPELTACFDGQRSRRNDTEDGRWRTEPSGSGDSSAFAGEGAQCAGGVGGWRQWRGQQRW
jgi:hypothetical protein